MERGAIECQMHNCFSDYVHGVFSLLAVCIWLQLVVAFRLSQMNAYCVRTTLAAMVVARMVVRPSSWKKVHF